MSLELIEAHGCFGGIQSVYSHQSKTTQCAMRFGLFLPPQANHQAVPVLYWLSGLTCTEQNFITKAGAQRIAATLGLAIVAPDTSPRGPGIPDEENDALGTGAGFYLDAIQNPWSKNYQMAAYIQEELPELINQHFSIDGKTCGIFGHSMGGHGALTLAIKNPHQYSSVSAFSPICAPCQSPWGKKAFSNYLGSDETLWREYDACELINQRGWPHQNILIDQGVEDPFLKKELMPNLFQTACKQAEVKLNLRMHPGYDHGYFFVASFIEDHLRFHAANIKKLMK